MTPLLEIRGVVVRAQDRELLDIAHLEIAPAETVALLGANGAGKSTLLRVAGALRSHDEGTVLLDGRPATEEALRSACAAVLQRPLLRRGSVQANVETGLRFRGATRSEARRLAAPWLGRLGIAHLRREAAHHLSSGEGQRVSLARALATTPRLLLLDEPFSALDAPTRTDLLADLRPILAEQGTATLLATHDPREAAALAHRIVILHGGHALQSGPVEDVLSRPADAICARLVRGFELGLGGGHPDNIRSDDGHPARDANDHPEHRRP